jgi:hypothetical protein
VADGVTAYRQRGATAAAPHEEISLCDHANVTGCRWAPRAWPIPYLSFIQGTPPTSWQRRWIYRMDPSTLQVEWLFQVDWYLPDTTH